MNHETILPGKHAITFSLEGDAILSEDVPLESMMDYLENQEKPICGWCKTKIHSNRYVTYILPDGTIKHTHGKERWFPEVYIDFGVPDTTPQMLQGPRGEILDFRETPFSISVEGDVEVNKLTLNDFKETT